jgi:hypothetical protein
MEKIIKANYTYCDGNGCEKKDSCARWIEHYSIALDDPFVWIIDASTCIDEYYIMFEKISRRVNAKN